MNKLKAIDQVAEKIEAVNHPNHYKSGKYECIDVMLDVFGPEKTKAFCELCAFKYHWRADKKGGVEDLKKAVFYTQKLIELEGMGNNE